MITDRNLSNEKHLIIKHIPGKGMQFCSDGEPLGNTITGVIKDIGRTEVEEYGSNMYFVKLASKSLDAVEEPELVVFWCSERQFCDMAVRLYKVRDVMRTEELAFTPVSDMEKKAHMLCVYEITNNAGKYEYHLVRATKEDRAQIKGLPEWETKGKFKDSTKQADFLFEELTK